jgi:hypothetical protein
MAANLWDDEKNVSDNSVPIDVVAIANNKPYDLVLEDYKLETALGEDTKEIVRMMYFSEQLTKAAFQIVDYVPRNLEGDEDNDFWQKKVKEENNDFFFLF